jgi:hypothetical protein
MRTLPADYLERAYAAVLGKLVGVYVSRPFENWTYRRIVEELGPIEYDVHDRLDCPLIVTDDDIAGTFTFIRALEDHGVRPDISSREIEQTWRNHIVEHRAILCWGGNGNSTEHTAWLNLQRGVETPASGSIARRQARHPEGAVRGRPRVRDLLRLRRRNHRPLNRGLGQRPEASCRRPRPSRAGEWRRRARHQRWRLLLRRSPRFAAARELSRARGNGLYSRDVWRRATRPWLGSASTMTRPNRRRSGRNAAASLPEPDATIGAVRFEEMPPWQKCARWSFTRLGDPW